MKKISGLNQRVATLVPPVAERTGETPPKPPTMKEVAMNCIALYRPKQNENTEPSERLKVTKLGMLFLTSTDVLEIEDEYYELFKKVINVSRGYPEFILGQWTEKFNKIDVEELDGKKKGK